MSTSSARPPWLGARGGCQKKNSDAFTAASWYFEFWSFPACLPVFTFQISQIAALVRYVQVLLLYSLPDTGWRCAYPCYPELKLRFFFFKQNFYMGTWILNVCNWPLLFLKQGPFWEKDQLHEAGGRDMWAATLETLRITLEWSPRNCDHLRASQKGSGWCSHAPCCVWMTALPRLLSPSPNNPPNSPSPFKKEQFPSIFVSCLLTDAVN